MRGEGGRTVTLTPSELLTPDGRPNQKASGEPYRWTYTLRGGGEEAWAPRFTYYGFRYVQVEGAVPAGADGPAGLPRVVSIEMAHTRNSAPETGRFETSLPLFNRIDGLVRWAIRSNLASVVTDCPHREKLGWLEQTYLMGDAVHFDHDLFGLYRKQVADVVDAQAEDGLVPDIAPEYVEFEGGFRDSPEWGGAGVILPWLVYRWYGDRDTLERAWPTMKRYVDYLGTKAEGRILSHGLGDWYDLGPRFPGEAQLTPKAVTATATWFRCLRVAAEAARVLGHPGDAARYEALAEEVRAAFNRTFFDPKTATWSTGSQTALAMPLVVGLAPDGEEGRVLESLVRRIEKDGRALTAGDIGFHYVVEALSRAGRGDLLFAMNARDDVPGYGFQLKKGATALTESWAALEEVSNNHLMLGHLVRWFYSGLLGIDQAEGSIGYASLVLKPQVVEGLEWARGEYRSPRGRIASSWRREPGRLVLEVEVPVNATAEVHLPAAAGARILESGRALEGRDDVAVRSRTEEPSRSRPRLGPLLVSRVEEEADEPEASRLLPEFDHEMAGTRKTLERVPEDRLGWRPHAKSMTLGGLASHLANLPSWIGHTVERDCLDLAPVGQRSPARAGDDLAAGPARPLRPARRRGARGPGRRVRRDAPRARGPCSAAASRTSRCRASPSCAASS